MSETVRLGGDPPSPYEGQIGFSRIVATEGVAFLGGTTSVTPDGAVLGETPYEQTVEILRKVAHELVRGGASIGDVVQVRIYVTDISRADEVGRALGETFRQIRPVMTMVEVSALIDPRMLVEIEALAIVGSGRAAP
ncbi:MAG TPA: Rid family hydrolase [Solirubrobacteraceae bacterium]|nr:Rid family hydrolase [Solirubrobacteraceae bacterium]